MKFVRALLAVAVVVIACIAVHRLCWMRYTCDVEKKNADRRLTRAFREMNESERVAVGRAMLARLRPCLDEDPFDYQLRVSYGMAADAAGQKSLAMEMYKAALALNERPEILANIAELQFELGQADEARANLQRAVNFHVAYVTRAAEPLRTELFEEMKARRARLLKAQNRPVDELKIPRRRS